MQAVPFPPNPARPQDLGRVHVIVDGAWLGKALAATLLARTGRSPPILRVGPGGNLTASWSRPRRRACGFDLDDGAGDAELLLLTARAAAPEVLCEASRRTASERPELLALADECWLAAPAERSALLQAAAWLARQADAGQFRRCRRRVVVDARGNQRDVPDRNALLTMFRPAAVYFAASDVAAPEWLAAVA